MASEQAHHSSMIEVKSGSDGIVAQNSFSADSPYYASYVENEISHMAVMHDSLHDIASRTKTFGKCGTLMSEATRRLALSCRLRRPLSAEDEKDLVDKARREQDEVQERRRAIGEEMTSLLLVMAEVSYCRGSLKLPDSYLNKTFV
jgi:hypothetical protein